MTSFIHTCKRYALIHILCVITCSAAFGQQTVFALFKNETRLGDSYYMRKNYPGALKLYQSASKKDPASRELHLKIAKCYFSLKQYDAAIASYDKYLKDRRNLPWADLYYYAESQAALSNYPVAIDYYRKYLVKEQDDQLVMKKIWRLANVQYLLEDSSYFSVRPVSMNTESGELCATPYRGGVVFMSNRKEPQLVEKINASLDAPFYGIYYSSVFSGSGPGNYRYGKASLFSKEFISRYNAGPVAFYDHDRKMVFVSTSTHDGTGKGHTLQLYFAEFTEGQWEVKSAYPFNSAHYSISDPTISKDGKVLFFSSDMGGGVGGKDIYRSTLVKEKWTRPENVGEPINTTGDEVFPYFHNNIVLYFSSNGHAGMGGLDIFKAFVRNDGYGEPQNAGYPMNSSQDDFGVVIDSLDTHGYLSSNRKNGGYDDDIYEFDMDLQSFPLTISGMIRFKEHISSGSAELKPMAHAKIYLIDNLRKATVNEGFSGDNGNFSLVIPYFSEFVIKIVGEEKDEHVVVLEIPRHRQQLSAHEIVIVKDIFNNNVENQE